ncbi:MAG: DUF2634 domain-containing protein [Lachnospiraceae bacterium]|nr:DUF2634 domain-containing protein [Lachnospiraceae bacterium]MDE6981635.1 DUF2634 domain-containing protein [Lachnospiraceae bacterium]
MTEELYPVFDVPEVSDEDEEEYDTEYKRSMKWDPASGDFVRDSTNRVMECSGQEAFMVWCYKIALTERYSCLAYPDEIGTELEDAVYDDDPDTVESMMQRTITEALMTNPRTESVDNFVFAWYGDTVNCTFDVVGIDAYKFQVII